MSNVIFVSDTCFRHRHNEEEPMILDGKKYGIGSAIIEFGTLRVFDTHMEMMVVKGQLILDSEKDKEKIEFLRAHPGYKKLFTERKVLPTTTNSNGSVIGILNDNATNNQTPVDVKEMQRQSVEKTIKYMELKQKYFKNDGGLKANFDKEDAEVAAELTEFENLKKELNL